MISSDIDFQASEIVLASLNMGFLAGTIFCFQLRVNISYRDYQRNFLSRLPLNDMRYHLASESTGTDTYRSVIIFFRDTVVSIYLRGTQRRDIPVMMFKVVVSVTSTSLTNAQRPWGTYSIRLDLHSTFDELGSLDGAPFKS